MVILARSFSQQSLKHWWYLVLKSQNESTEAKLPRVATIPFNNKAFYVIAFQEITLAFTCIILSIKVKKEFLRFFANSILSTSSSNSVVFDQAMLATTEVAGEREKAVLPTVLFFDDNQNFG